MKWKVGDRALIVNCSWWHHCGEIATLTAPHPDKPNRWLIDLPPAPSFHVCACPEKHLRPIPYDGLEISSWNECEWQPKVTV